MREFVYWILTSLCFLCANLLLYVSAQLFSVLCNSKGYLKCHKEVYESI